MKPLQKGNTQVLIAVLVGVLILSAFLYFKNNLFQTSSETPIPSQTPAMQTYTNSKYGYSIQYPPTFYVREFDTKTGAGFGLVGRSRFPENEVITIDVLEKNAAMADDPLSDYIKAAAIIQIQNYQKLNTSEEIKTNSGLIGYKTTWEVAPMPNLNATASTQTTISLPITYFDLPEATISSTVQIYLNDQNFTSDYDKMIKTFSLN